jgi:hypothetical protein
MLYTSYKYLKWTNSLIQPHEHTDSIWRAFIARDECFQPLCCQWPKHNVSANEPTRAIFVLSYARAPANQFIDIITKLLLLLTIANGPWCANFSSLSRIHDHNQTHHIREDTSGRVISPTQRPLPDNTSYSQVTYFHPSGRIRTRSPTAQPFSANEPTRAGFLLSYARAPAKQFIYVVLNYYH